MAAAKKVLMIVCAKAGKGAKLTTSAGVVDQTTPLAVPKAEAEGYIATKIARLAEPEAAADAD